MWRDVCQGSSSGFILQDELKGFTEGLAVEYERRVLTTRILARGTKKMVLSFTETGKVTGQVGLGEKWRSAVLDLGTCYWGVPWE